MFRKLHPNLLIIITGLLFFSQPLFAFESAESEGDAPPPRPVDKSCECPLNVPESALWLVKVNECKGCSDPSRCVEKKCRGFPIHEGEGIEANTEEGIEELLFGDPIPGNPIWRNCVVKETPRPKCGCPPINWDSGTYGNQNLSDYCAPGDIAYACAKHGVTTVSCFEEYRPNNLCLAEKCKLSHSETGSTDIDSGIKCLIEDEEGEGGADAAL